MDKGNNLNTIESIQNALAKNRQEVGQRYADLPKTEANMRADLFGNDQALNALRQNEVDKIKQLWSFDKDLATQYKPENPGFIEDPGARARYGGNQLADIGGELADLQKNIATRQDILGDALDRGMKMLLYGLEAKKYESSSLEKELEMMLGQKKQNRSDLLNILQLTGGALPPEVAAELGLPEGTTFPNPYAKSGAEKADRAAEKQAERSLQATDEFIADMQADVSSALAADPKANVRSLIWKWINTNEPYFGAAGVDAKKLWDIYNKTPNAPKAQAQQPQKKGTALEWILDKVKNGEVAMPKG